MNQINKFRNIAIACRSCKNNWSIQIPITGNQVEVFASICDCGALIIGNYNYLLHKSLSFQTDLTNELYKKIYLTNGHFDVIPLTEEEIKTLPSLSVE